MKNPVILKKKKTIETTIVDILGTNIYHSFIVTSINVMCTAILRKTMKIRSGLLKITIITNRMN